MKRIINLLAVLFFVVSLAACGNINDTALNTAEMSQAGSVTNTSAASGTTVQNARYPMTIKDSYDREIIIEKEPQRIVSVAPNITETIFALEGGTGLVGRTDYCDYPAEASKIESVGTLQEPSIEKIAELKPDLVIASTHFSEDTLAKLEGLKIPTVVLYGEESFDGVYATISSVGKIINKEEKAKSLIAGMKEKTENVKKSVEGRDKPSVYYVISYGKSGDYTAGKDTFIGQLLETAGAENAAADVADWKYSLERLIEKNPDIMICPSIGGYKQGLEATNGYKDLSAVKNNKLFEIDENLINRQGPRLAEGLVELAKIIHPEAFR
ncbi:iron complex transport system substrate-binding protein [Ruminiclostridium sufflavum DSM 19573]|uniref:Iron complex transport system substrate-binding protein n=1 Tax=Ruminiclostridium sufflavum DSM 19573 TaxID=1121337 RepID=A0A318XPT9_9FIRM|nr:ABC transporter substrate-binding protein [Ruminiclostridium sufflavum]PYG89075.1 iron complex transport system substrate-binding protein [Ruminiclostridium sufflavum DSM 19573]